MSNQDKEEPKTYVREDGCVCPIAVKEEVEEKCPKILSTCPYDPRFPNQNQTRHCYISFIDYQRCVRLLGDYPGCLYFLRCYRSLCPTAWTERWFDQMEKGTFPKKIYPTKPIVRPEKIPCMKSFNEEPPEQGTTVC